MSTYLKKGIRPAVFIIVLLLLLQGLSYFFITRGNGNKNALSVMKQPENSIDYLVIGDSESYSSISPMEIWIKHGLAGYNCGVVGQQAQYTYYLLDVYKRQTPHRAGGNRADSQRIGRDQPGGLSLPRGEGQADRLLFRRYRRQDDSLQNAEDDADAHDSSGIPSVSAASDDGQRKDRPQRIESAVPEIKAEKMMKIRHRIADKSAGQQAE